MGRLCWPSSFSRPPAAQAVRGGTPLDQARFAEEFVVVNLDVLVNLDERNFSAKHASSRGVPPAGGREKKDGQHKRPIPLPF